MLACYMYHYNVTCNNGTSILYFCSWQHTHNMCSGLGKGAIWAQVVILRKGGSKFNDIHINMLIKNEYHYLSLIIFGAH